MRALASEIEARLQDLGRSHRAGSVDGHSTSAQRVLGVIVPDLRALVRDVARDLRASPADDVVALARLLCGQGTLEARQVGFELVGRRGDVRTALGVRGIEALGEGNDNWKSVDVFGCDVAGPAWREGVLSDATIHRWARHRDLWWRRTALVATVPLNLKSRGGSGDGPRTLAVCALCAGDREDMVVKALSWALRELAKREPESVGAFLERHGDILASRVRREVQRKLATGRKHG